MVENVGIEFARDGARPQWLDSPNHIDAVVDVEPESVDTVAQVGDQEQPVCAGLLAQSLEKHDQEAS